MRKSKGKCKICGEIDILIIEEIVGPKEKPDYQYEERCANCGNLRYGVIKKWNGFPSLVFQKE